MLFRDGLVMYDRETDTLWTQVDGKAIKGPLAGAQLARAPAYPAFWFGWLSYFPVTELWTR